MIRKLFAVVLFACSGTIVAAEGSAPTEPKPHSETHQRMEIMNKCRDQHNQMIEKMSSLSKETDDALKSNDPVKMNQALNDIQKAFSEMKSQMSECMGMMDRMKDDMAGCMGMMKGMQSKAAEPAPPEEQKQTAPGTKPQK